MQTRAATRGRFYRWSILGLSSVGGLGYLPWAPGTFGTLAALPLWWLLAKLSAVGFALVVVALIGLSIAIAGRAEALYGAHDVRHIVIDEVVGLLTAAVALPFDWPHVVLAFALFRLLDATKPPPVRWFDTQVRGGLGVVLDDVVAGLLTCILVRLIFL